MSEEKDMLAGEYVLGLLSEAEAERLEAEAATDPELARAVAGWQARLDPLADTLPPVAPTPHLWARIDADTKRPIVSPGAPPRRVSGDGWRKVALASMLLAACLVAYIGWSRWGSQEIRAPVFQAEALLAAPGSVRASVRVQVLRSGELVVVPLQKLVLAQGRQMDVWAWPREEKAPVLLGAVREDGGAARYPYPARDGTPVMITEEMQGGGVPASPGPTLFAGLLVVSR